jgi:hypothetical protein
MLAAESRCRKLCKGAVAFSLATESPRRCVHFWILAIKRHQNGRVNPALWNRTKNWAKINESVDPLSLDELRTRLLHARQDYREAKKSHKESQVKFLDTLSTKDRSRLLRTKKQRKLGRLAKRISGKTQGQSVLTVLHNGEDLVTQTEVESTQLQVNESKVRASEDTPFMQEPLSSAFGFTNSTQATQEVLQGTYQCPADVDTHA